MNNNVLFVGRDSSWLKSFKEELERLEFRLFISEPGEAMNIIRRVNPQLALLELELTGSEFCRLLKSDKELGQLPLIVLSHNPSIERKIECFGLGVDDFLSIPFINDELIARIKAVMRRVQPAEERGTPDTKLGNDFLELDLVSYLVRVQGKPVRLTSKEIDLLYVMLKKEGKVLSRQYLLERVWGYDYFGSTRTIDVHIRRLRKKLGTRAARLIQTVPKIGYKFSV